MKWYGWIIIGALLAVILWLLLRGCAKTQPAVPVVKTDTVIITVNDTIERYTPIEKTVYVPRETIVIKSDSFFIVEPVDTSNILFDYYSTVYYEDSAIIQYGKVFINDSVTQNRIKSRFITSRLQIPTIKETVTITEPKRNKLFLGFEGVASKKLNYGEGNIKLMFMTKNDKAIEIGTGYSTRGDWLFSAGYKFKLSLKK